MAGLNDGHDPRGPSVSMAGDREPADGARGFDVRVEVLAFRDLRHGARGLAGGEDNQTTIGRRRRQMLHQASGGMRRADGALEQMIEKVSVRHLQPSRRYLTDPTHIACHGTTPPMETAATCDYLAR